MRKKGRGWKSEDRIWKLEVLMLLIGIGGTIGILLFGN